MSSAIDLVTPERQKRSNSPGGWFRSAIDAFLDFVGWAYYTWRWLALLAGILGAGWAYLESFQ